jgi:hypothetical protein
MFKLRDILLSGEFTDNELSNALIGVATYTYRDRTGDCGYDIAATPEEGASDTGVVHVGRVVIIASAPDATMLITDYASGKMGIVPMSAEEDAFVRANPVLMTRIAALLGYSDYLVYGLTTPDTGYRSRLVWQMMSYNYATGQGYITLEKYESGSRASGVYHPDGTPNALFITVDEANPRVAPNGVVKWNPSQMRIPEEYYLTDMQNVQDVARRAVQLNAAHSDAQDAVMTEAFADVTALVGSLSVFGDSVKAVTDRYNKVTQYIPRP